VPVLGPAGRAAGTNQAGAAAASGAKAQAVLTEHEAFPQPGGKPAWCFCRHEDCRGWGAYTRWYQDYNGTGREPDDETVQAHSLITRLLAELVSHYSDLFGTGMDFDLALDLAGIDRSSEAAGSASPRSPPER
jgi:hypothetical protein